MIHQWTPQIGDPSFLGWLTVACYFAAGFLCMRAANRDASAKNPWRMLGLALFCLGINKQIDLQTLLTEIGRDFARTGHWYDQRREFQRIFVTVVGSVSVAGAVAAILLFKNRSRAFRTALIGFVSLAGFVCIRAASFHHVDSFLKQSLLGARFNWIFELGGIAVIGFAAAQVRIPARFVIKRAG